MGCTIEIQNTTPVNREWFQAAIDNDIYKIQSLKQECLSTFHNGLCALHYAIIYNSLDVFVELLPEEGLLATTSDISLVTKEFTAKSNILELSVICDNYKLTKLILDFFYELSKSYDLVASNPLQWCLNNFQQNCVTLVMHKFFKKQFQQAVNLHINILTYVQNENLFNYLNENFEDVPDYFLNILSYLLLPSDSNREVTSDVLKELQDKVRGKEEQFKQSHIEVLGCCESFIE
ncbi:Ankyrin_repeat-containing domain superfamily [Hexamita inflata]|uniref:Ankyrin repeat-containing domain superfamily n=1 Tax=Hexamita inflata TaxID=28002 RepID=A0AA86NLE5_9EUKA|nr:Ankyrin repeat-containing domain superfamily [Hexamita inflata]CAI9921276.1 Ankyrin repeat-containing domain superfamily [Hexamita inflata]CAI9967454.1 Ankyrin repeat-containing domain superfamily [Hexamita inflata]